MIEFFQITGSASFAARIALEEAGAEYTPVNVHPRRRDEPASFGEVNPLRRVPALREGDVEIYETGAVLLWLADRFPESDLGPGLGDPSRGDLYRWVVWTANTLHSTWWPIMRPSVTEPDEAARAAIRARRREATDAHGAYLERELANGPFALGDTFSVADAYLYMLIGWQSYITGDYRLGGERVEAYYRHVGERPSVVRARELDDLDERLIRYHPELRAGLPI